MTQERIAEINSQTLTALAQRHEEWRAAQGRCEELGRQLEAENLETKMLRLKLKIALVASTIGWALFFTTVYVFTGR